MSKDNAIHNAILVSGYKEAEKNMNASAKAGRWADAEGYCQEAIQKRLDSGRLNAAAKIADPGNHPGWIAHLRTLQASYAQNAQAKSAAKAAAKPAKSGPDADGWETA